MRRGEIGSYELKSIGGEWDGPLYRRRRTRLFVYDRYHSILNEGTEAP